MWPLFLPLLDGLSPTWGWLQKRREVTPVVVSQTLSFSDCPVKGPSVKIEVAWSEPQYVVETSDNWRWLIQQVLKQTAVSSKLRKVEGRR